MLEPNIKNKPLTSQTFVTNGAQEPMAACSPINNALDRRELYNADYRFAHTLGMRDTPRWDRNEKRLEELQKWANDAIN